MDPLTQPRQKVHTVYVSKQYENVWEVAIRHSGSSGQSLSSIIGEALKQFLLPALLEERDITQKLFAKAIEDGESDE